jgi:hypothetical protein
MTWCVVLSSILSVLCQLDYLPVRWEERKERESSGGEREKVYGNVSTDPKIYLDDSGNGAEREGRLVEFPSHDVSCILWFLDRERRKCKEIEEP